MPSTAWNHRDTARANRMLGPLDVHQYLPLEHDEGLVLMRGGVKRRCLASRHPILEQNESAPGLLGGCLHHPHTFPGQPAVVALLLPPEDRKSTRLNSRHAHIS